MYTNDRGIVILACESTAKSYRDASLSRFRSWFLLKLVVYQLCFYLLTFARGYIKRYEN